MRANKSCTSSNQNIQFFQFDPFKAAIRAVALPVMKKHERAAIIASIANLNLFVRRMVLRSRARCWAMVCGEVQGFCQFVRLR